MDYTHSPLGEEIEAIGGSYSIDTESCLDYNDRQVVYIVGGTGFMRSCCGSGGGLRFITVPGFVKAWQHKKNENGYPVSEVELVRDEESQKEIKKILAEKYCISNIAFW